MNRRYISAGLMFGLAIVGACGSRQAHGVDPNPLQSAYYRLEEGIAGQPVPTGVDGSLNDTVLDSINDNRMEAYNPVNAPLYVNNNLPPTYLRSGDRNNLAWQVNGTPTGGQDVYTSTNELIQNGIVGGKYDHDNNDETETIASTTTGFTLEAAFNVSDFDFIHAIIAKEGRPALELGIGDAVLQTLPTMALKVLGPQGPDGLNDPNVGKLQIELFDQAGSLKSVTSSDVLTAGQWYYAAVVNDGSNLSLYLDQNDGQGYQLEGSTAVDGALFQGASRDDASWNKNWTIGRGVRDGITDGTPSDWFTGFLDEIRLTDKALQPSEFLFSQTRIGDLNADGKIDGGDFLAWQRGFGSEFDEQDFDDWAAHFGDSPAATASANGVPEPASCGLAAIAALALLRRRRSA